MQACNITTGAHMLQVPNVIPTLKTRRKELMLQISPVLGHFGFKMQRYTINAAYAPCFQVLWITLHQTLRKIIQWKLPVHNDLDFKYKPTDDPLSSPKEC